MFFVWLRPLVEGGSVKVFDGLSQRFTNWGLYTPRGMGYTMCEKIVLNNSFVEVKY